MAGDVKFTYACVRPPAASSSAADVQSRCACVWPSMASSSAADVKSIRVRVVVDGEQLGRRREVQAPYVDPRTKLRYADPEVFKQIRNLPDEYVQRYLAVRNAAVVLR
ncbi:hypothetical protein ACQ4PT_051031 [Festuca glaucescens]